jgi:hypothetical protein
LPRIFDTNQATEAGQITRYLDLGLPILDLAVLSPDLVLVSLDSSFPSDPSSPSPSFRTLSLTPDKVPQHHNLTFFFLSVSDSFLFSLDSISHVD